jgi:Glycosyltransferase family 87
MLNTKYLSIFLLIILGGFTFRYGILPALNNINSDFPNYYTSSRLLIEGKDLSKIYDDDWFNQQIKNYGIYERGKFSPFPPPTTFVMVPISFFDPISAKRIFIIINLFILLGTAYIFTKISAFNYINCINIILISGAAIINNFLLGQVYLLLLFTITLGYFFLRKEKEYSTGYWWGIGAAVKYFPIIYIPILLIKKKWKGVIGFIITIIIINLITFFFMGHDVYRQFFNQVLFSHINGELSNQSKYAVQFQSWNSFLRILFIADPIENKMPLINSPSALFISRILVYIIFTGITAFVIYKIRNDKNFLPYSSAMLTLLLLVISPASATYHLLILSFPLVLLITKPEEQKKNLYSIIFVSIYILIAYLPFIIYKVSFLKGNLLFSFYRLWLLVIFFIVAVKFILIRREQNR